MVWENTTGYRVVAIYYLKPDIATRTKGSFLTRFMPACGFCVGRFMVRCVIMNWKTLISLPLRISHPNPIKTPWDLKFRSNWHLQFPLLAPDFSSNLKYHGERAKFCIPPNLMGTLDQVSLCWIQRDMKVSAISNHFQMSKQFHFAQILPIEWKMQFFQFLSEISSPRVLSFRINMELISVVSFPCGKQYTPDNSFSLRQALVLLRISKLTHFLFLM